MEIHRLIIEDFQGIENALYDSIMMDAWHYTVAQTLIECIPTVNPTVNYELGSL